MVGRAAGIPNGTGMPDGTPPRDEPPSPPILPPVPPFPTLGDDMASGMLDRYEVMHDSPKIRMGDRAWKPQGASSHEPRPGEARAFWLEREVVALKHSPEKMTNWNPFKSSECWSNGFQSSLGFPAGSEKPDKPVDLGRPDPDLAERISREHPGDLPGRSLGGSPS